jgi:hypothetical protein
MIELQNELKDLEILVKGIWPHCDKWRLCNGHIEFSVKKGKNDREWFPLFRAPYHVEKFVRAWESMGGLNNQI